MTKSELRREIQRQEIKDLLLQWEMDIKFKYAKRPTPAVLRNRIMKIMEE